MRYTQFLEEIGETTDEIDRRLSHLWLAGKFQELIGLVFGKFVGCDYCPTWAKRFTLSEVLSERCKAVKIPTLRGLMIGHVDDQTTVPIGCEAELDVDAGILTIVETAVS